MAPEWHLPANMYSGRYFRKCFHTLILKADWRPGGHKGRNPRKKTFSLGIAQRKRGELQKLILEIIKSKKKLPILVCRGDSVAQINFDTFLWPSGDPGNGLVWDDHHPPTHPHRPGFWSDCWNPLQTELNYQLFSGWYQMILDVFRCSQLFSAGLQLL